MRDGTNPVRMAPCTSKSTLLMPRWALDEHGRGLVAEVKGARVVFCGNLESRTEEEEEEEGFWRSLR